MGWITGAAVAAAGLFIAAFAGRITVRNPKRCKAVRVSGFTMAAAGLLLAVVGRGVLL